jgi:molecular chaperone HtpG
MSQIAISQKGVFVNNYSSSFLRPTLGNLNLRKKLDININRNKFSDIEKIHKIMIQFEVLLVPQLISHLSNENQSLSKIDISDEFLENYFQAFSNEHLLKEFYTVFRENIYIRYFDGSIVNEMAISDLIDKYTQFILITNKDDHELIYNTFKIPVIITTIFQYSNLFYSYLNIFNKIYSYNLNIVCINGIGFQKLTKDIVTKKIDPKSNLLSNHYLYNSQSIDENFLLINPWVNKPGYLEEDFDYGEIIFNNNHPFLQFIFENAIEIEKNAEYLKIIYAVLNSLSNIEYYKEKNHESIIEELNDLMSPLTKIGTVPKLGLIDFPKLKPTKIKS